MRLYIYIYIYIYIFIYLFILENLLINPTCNALALPIGFKFQYNLKEPIAIQFLVIKSMWD